MIKNKKYYICQIHLMSLQGQHLDITKDQIVGNSITGVQVFKDEKGEIGMFFIFPDIGLVAPGQYKFRCIVMDMRSYNYLN